MEGLTSSSQNFQKESKRESPGSENSAPKVAQHKQLMHLTHLNLTSPKTLPKQSLLSLLSPVRPEYF